VSGIVALFRDLDRLGPGSSESLRWALGVAKTPSDARLLDAGCGTGADISALCAAAPAGQVTALDAIPEFIDRVRARNSKIIAYTGDMTDPPGGPYDLIWSAGAVYTIGVTTALRAWRGHLAPGGHVAFSDLRARVASVPAEVSAFWASEGVDLQGADALDAEVAAAGYRILGSRWVGPAGWASYYGPLEAELDSVDADPELVASLRAEIALWRTHGVSYGYRLVVAKPE